MSLDKLGLGDTRMREIAVRVNHPTVIKEISAGGNQSAFVDAANDLYVTGANSEGQLGLGDTLDKSSFTKVSDLPPIAKVAVGKDHILVLDIDGNVWVSGSKKEWNVLGIIQTHLPEKKNTSNLFLIIGMKVIISYLIIEMLTIIM